MTTYVPASTPTGGYKQRRAFISNSAAFCPDYGVPCRLVQYSEPVVIEACTEFLSYSSGTAPAPSNPKGAVSSGEVFTTGSSDNGTSNKRAMKHSKKDKNSMSDGKGKMKPQM